MLTLIRNAEVYSPEPLGRRDVLLAGGRIAAIDKRISLAGDMVEEVDAHGMWLLPGFVDPLTHPAGGGGEGGFANRTTELDAADFVAAGVTTPVGALGTDSITRGLEVLYGQVMKLRANGLSALMYSGSYRVPASTLTGDVARDLVLVDPVIGVGETAIADHRSSHPSAHELRRLAADVHLGGTLSGKGGVLFLHLGDGDSGLGLVEELLAASDLPRRLFYPTHCNRNPRLLDRAIEHARRGGYADFTVSTTPELLAAGEVPAHEALQTAIGAGVPAGRLTLSSDAGGSLPHYLDGKLAGIREAGPETLLDLLRAALDGRSDTIPSVIAALTRNPADALHLARKGRIESGADADLLILDPAARSLNDVFCGGRRLMRAGRLDIL
jgi:beta-aspartyl-dipeptidase (metallo-type)